MRTLDPEGSDGVKSKCLVVFQGGEFVCIDLRLSYLVRSGERIFVDNSFSICKKIEPFLEVGIASELSEVQAEFEWHSAEVGHSFVCGILLVPIGGWNECVLNTVFLACTYLDSVRKNVGTGYIHKHTVTHPFFF